MPGLTLINLPGSTCDTLTSAEACHLPINLDGGSATSSDYQISSGTSDNCNISCFVNLFDLSTTTKTYTGFAPRQASTNLPSGASTTLTSHVADKKTFSLDAGNETLDNCNISCFVNLFDFSTTTKTYTGFVPRQASTNLYNVSKRHSGAPSSHHPTLSSRTHIL
eukprot:SAG31_NODE_6279_length_2089_cov_12.803015_2_plen_164_part_01